MNIIIFLFTVGSSLLGGYHDVVYAGDKSRKKPFMEGTYQGVPIAPQDRNKPFLEQVFQKDPGVDIKKHYIRVDNVTLLNIVVVSTQYDSSMKFELDIVIQHLIQITGTACATVAFASDRTVINYEMEVPSMLKKILKFRGIKNSENLKQALEKKLNDGFTRIQHFQNERGGG